MLISDTWVRAHTVLDCSERLSQHPARKVKHGFQPWNQSADRAKATLIWREEQWLDGGTVNTGCHHMSPWGSWPLAIYSTVTSSDDPFVTAMATYLWVGRVACLLILRQDIYWEKLENVTCQYSGNMRLRHWAVTDVTRALMMKWDITYIFVCTHYTHYHLRVVRVKHSTMFTSSPGKPAKMLHRAEGKRRVRF